MPPRHSVPTTSSARRRQVKVGALALTAVVGLFPLIGGTASAATSTIGNDDIASACSATTATPTFCTSTRAGGKAAVVTAGATDPKPDTGTGYLHLSTLGTPGLSDKVTVFAQQFIGKKLSEISDLAYETYIEQVGSNPQQAPALNIEVNPMKAGQSFTTLVWEPLYTGPVTPTSWQKWSPSSTPSGRGGWWASGAANGSSTGTPNALGFNTYTASFADVKAAIPDAVIGKIGINQGGGNDGLVADADQLKVNDTTVDFDNPVVPTGIAATGGDKQTAEVGKPFAQPLAATLSGANAAPVPGRDVVFTVTRGSASFGGSPTATAPTDAKGVATSPTLAAGTTAGPVEVTVISGTFSTTFTETVVPKEADLSVTVAGLAPTTKAGASVPLTLAVRNGGPVAATQVGTGFSVPAGFKVTKAPGGAISRDGRSVGYLASSIAPGTTTTYAVTVVVDRSVRGVQTLSAGTATTQVKDPNLRNNAAQVRTTVVK